MDSLTLPAKTRANGIINMPGSKSLSNRALLLASLAKGTTKLNNLLDSDDIQHMLNALTKLGVDYHLDKESQTCVVKGLGGAFVTEDRLSLYLGNAGTAMRPLCAALAFSQVSVDLTGEPRMEERPIGDLANELINSGASIKYLKNEGYPPLSISPGTINTDTFTIDGSVSSQFLTALLMASPILQKKIHINIVGELVSKPYIDITLDIMKKFGVKVTNENYETFIIDSDQEYVSPGEFLVEGDASSASYFLAAGAIAGGPVRVTGVGSKSIQGDTAFADVLSEMGAEVRWGDDFIEVTGTKLKSVDLDMNHIPDAAMTIATTALFAEGTTKISNVYNWRVKETDRLHAMSTELQKVGASVIEGEDFIEITPPKNIKHAKIDTYNDHRMAMCFALLSFKPESVTINEPGCTAKTFPDFFSKFENITS